MSPINEQVKESLRLIEDLKFFLATAPANWQENQVIRRYYLNHDEGFVSCVFWNNLYFITGTDIVRCIVYKFEHFGRKIIDRKKFEEGIFLDLRNLKCNTDAILEPPRSDFLEFLFKNACLRTQKKQKVFFWFNVPHDKLMADALERDFKKEKLGQKPTTIAYREPALSFNYDETNSLYAQLQDHMELQKKLTHSSTASSSSDDPSPEYTLTTTLHNDKDPFPAHTPTEFQHHSDHEDDFPLDYFDLEQLLDPTADYIRLDSTFVPGLEYEDEFVDPTIFTNPSSHVMYNDEYLIEQTQPLKTPVAPPKLAFSEFFPEYYPPPSAKYPQHFPPGPPPPRVQYYDPMPPYEEYWAPQPYEQVPYVYVDQEYPQPYEAYPTYASPRQQQPSMIKKRQLQRLRTPVRKNYNLDDIIASKATRVVNQDTSKDQP